MAKDRTDGADATHAVAGPAPDPGAGWQVSLDQVRALADAAPVAVIAVDGEGRISLVNARAEEMFGYGRYELTGSPIDILLPEQFREAHAGYRAGFFAQPFVRPMGLGRSVAARRKDGSEFAVDCGLSFLEVAGETLAVAFVTDVTERKQAEEALRDSEAKFRRLAATAPVAVAIVQGTSIVYANSAAATLLGCRLDELLARAPTDFIHPECRELLQGRAAARLRAEDVPSRYEAKLLTKGGQERWVEVNSSLTEFEGKPAILGTAFDITERKRAEEEAAKFKAIADNANYGAAIADLAGNLTYVNGYFARVHGYEPGELVGRNLTVFHRGQQLEDVRRINEDLQERGSYSALEVWHSHRDGTAFPMLMSGMILRDAGGEPQFMAATAINITEQKQAEEELRGSEERYRRLADASFEGVAIQGDGRILDANEALGRMFGYEVKELVGMRAVDLAAPESREALRQRVRRLDERGFEMTGRRKDGSTFPLELRIRAVTYQGQDARVVAIHDLTEHKVVIDARRHAREELEGRVERRMANHNPYGLTFREFTVLSLVAEGKADKEVALELDIRTATAQKHISNILHKMNAASRTEAGVRAVREGLLD